MGDGVRIDADLMIPGLGDPVREATVVLSGGSVVYAGPRADAPVTDAPTVSVPTVMPGLWDCHTHLLGMTTGDLTMLLREPQAVHVARATRSAAALLDAGFTSIRELGGYGLPLSRVIDEGTIPGPAVYAAGAMLSTTGGHGDLHELPVELIEHSATQGMPMQLCDGVAECLKAVRLQLRKNAKVIKVHASGGVLSEVDDPIHQQFSAEELRVIVEEAGRAERVVAAHCHGKPGMMAALEAGVGSIEHGTYLDDEVATAMKETGAVLVSTRSIVARSLTVLDTLPPWAATKGRRIADRHLESMHIAREAGVTIAVGTDFATVGATSFVPHGTNAEELGHLVSVGYTPLEAIRAATAAAPLTLGPQAPKAGRLAPGYDADVIALDADPLADISVLAGPRHVTHVWKLGRAVKQPA